MGLDASQSQMKLIFLIQQRFYYLTLQWLRMSPSFALRNLPFYRLFKINNRRELITATVRLAWFLNSGWIMEGQPLPKEKSLWNLSACIFVPLWYLKRLFLSSLACLDLMKQRKALCWCFNSSEKTYMYESIFLTMNVFWELTIKKKKKNSFIFVAKKTFKIQMC